MLIIIEEKAQMSRILFLKVQVHGYQGRSSLCFGDKYERWDWEDYDWPGDAPQMAADFAEEFIEVMWDIVEPEFL